MSMPSPRLAAVVIFDPLAPSAQRMAAPPVYRPGSIPVQARMAAPPVYRPGSIPVQARMAAPPVHRPGCPVETSLGQRPSVGQASIQAMLKPAYVPIALQEPKKQKGNFLAASGKQEANVVKITKAKADRKKVKDDAHKKWLGVLTRAAGEDSEEAQQNQMWVAHHEYAAARERARETYNRTIAGLDTNTGITGAPGLSFATIHQGDNAYVDIRLADAKRKVYRRKGGAADKHYVKDSNGAYVRRLAYRCITKAEAETIGEHGLARKSKVDLRGQDYSEKADAKFNAFDRLLDSQEEASRDVLHQIIGGGYHQFQISATSSTKRELRSNAGKAFDDGDNFGGLYEIDLAMIPEGTHVAAQYTQTAIDQRMGLLGLTVLPERERSNILRQIRTSAEKNIEVLLAAVPKEALRQLDV